MTEQQLKEFFAQVYARLVIQNGLQRKVYDEASRECLAAAMQLLDAGHPPGPLIEAMNTQPDHGAAQIKAWLDQLNSPPPNQTRNPKLETRNSKLTRRETAHVEAVMAASARAATQTSHALEAELLARYLVGPAAERADRLAGALHLLVSLVNSKTIHSTTINSLPPAERRAAFLALLTLTSLLRQSATPEELREWFKA